MAPAMAETLLMLLMLLLPSEEGTCMVWIFSADRTNNQTKVFI